jgi:hypothetical protein
MHVHESMHMMIHGVELLDIGTTGHYEAQNKVNSVFLGRFLPTFVVICRYLNWLMSF